jgi:predicted nucleotide-binding protein
MRSVAHCIEGLGHTPLEWDCPKAFVAGENTLSRIIEISREVDAAVFVFGEDDKLWYRNSPMVQPRDNVLVEYGLFAGVFGPERALMCRKGHAKTPSDLDGIVHVDISEGAKWRLFRLCTAIKSGQASVLK